MNTTLITFMIQTTTSTQSVHLIGSWDNFSKRYAMERDIRRSRGQWRGCYAFDDIICDGDGRSNPKRTGGLKMGSTYYYYYELDQATEHFDTSIPFTTSCPYLPGQPVNLLHVPTEIEPLRERSASMTSVTSSNLKTMNPSDKFMAPRQPPPPPALLLPRLNTSPSKLERKRTARSLSPKVDKQWSARDFFGLRSPPTTMETDARGRSASVTRMADKGVNASTATSSSRSNSSRRQPTRLHSRSPSPSLLSAHSREPSPLRQTVDRASGGYATTTFTVPDEIAEEIEDDENFASDQQRKSIHEKGLFTRLSPPPSARPSPPVRSQTNTSKPLPDLPALQQARLSEALPIISFDQDRQTVLIPEPLRLRPSLPNLSEPRSHFSVSTVATSMGSPTSSYFSFSDAGLDEEESEQTGDLGSGDDCSHSPVLDLSPILSPGKGFAGYSLPEGDYASEQTLRKQTPLSPVDAAATRTTFGAATFSPVCEVSEREEDENLTALGLLMSEMGYLGDVIVRK